MRPFAGLAASAALSIAAAFMLTAHLTAQSASTALQDGQTIALWQGAAPGALGTADSDIPAITHIDYSARIQTVTRETNRRYYELIKAFERRTGCGVLINTSFNVRGEPIVCTPQDAYRCFMRTNIDALVLGPFLLEKGAQPDWKDDLEWQKEFQLD